MSVEQKIIVILGTARDDSNTLKKLREQLPFKNFDLIELRQLNIEQYDYTKSPNDDFLRIAEKMVSSEVIVFATPVYWYSMSGVMKVFFDRLTELISTSKNLGRALAGKKVFLFSTGTDPELPVGFEVPFKKTCEYFDMIYERAFYICTRD